MGRRYSRWVFGSSRPGWPFAQIGLKPFFSRWYLTNAELHRPMHASACKVLRCNYRSRARHEAFRGFQMPYGVDRLSGIPGVFFFYALRSPGRFTTARCSSMCKAFTITTPDPLCRWLAADPDPGTASGEPSVFQKIPRLKHFCFARFVSGYVAKIYSYAHAIQLITALFPCA